ncbi:MAG: hypothetical protein MZW92_40110 [Comamonadaceae bacterium]|nr:hypothetical protein [Comamonadaceae bacterium]
MPPAACSAASSSSIVARRQRQSGRRRPRRRGAARRASSVDAADGHVPVERRPGRRRLRQAAQGAVPRRRAAHRQDRLGERQRATRSGCAPRPTCRRAMLVPEAAKLGKKRWAIVYPNYEYGQAAAASVQAR